MQRELGKLGKATCGEAHSWAGGPGHRHPPSLLSLAENMSLHGLGQHHDSGCLGPTLAV